ncbi:MAG: hypothetical protein GYA21_11200 [Myxococcales bacterium]|nr:hypothetical protein [Myxococcales bacterium]
MPDPAPTEPNRADEALERAAAEKEPSLIAEFFDFLRHNKKWWLIPLLIVLLVLGTLMIVGGSGAAPFIYALF